MAKRDEERERRLAEALRENLRRRKAQARGAQVARGIAVEAGEPESPQDEAGPRYQPVTAPPPGPGED